MLINEWIAGSQISFREDQVEFYNPVHPACRHRRHLPFRYPGSPHELPPPPAQLRRRSWLRRPRGRWRRSLLPVEPPALQTQLLLRLDGPLRRRRHHPRPGARHLRPDRCSEGRLPDGSSDIQILDFPSSGLTNVNGILPIVTTAVSTLSPTANPGPTATTSTPPAVDGDARTWTALDYTETGWFTGDAPRL